MSDSPPVVTFGIPAYKSPFLEEALRSVLSQTLSNIEVVVSDDGQSDSTQQLVRQLGDPRVKYSRPLERGGVPPNWNRCLRLAKGKYFTLLPDDDCLLPDFAEKMVAALEANPSIGFAQCGFLAIDEEGRLLEARRVEPPKSVMTGVDALRWELQTLRCNPAATMFCRERIVAMGGWQETYWDDWAVIMRMAFRHGLVFLNDHLSMVRRHPTNLSGVMMRDGRDEVLDLLNQTTAAFGEALPATVEIMALRAERYKDLSHRYVLKALKHTLQGEFGRAIERFRIARSLYAFAGFNPGFIVVGLRTKLYGWSITRQQRAAKSSPALEKVNPHRLPESTSQRRNL